MKAYVCLIFVALTAIGCSQSSTRGQTENQNTQEAASDSEPKHIDRRRFLPPIMPKQVVLTDTALTQAACRAADGKWRCKGPNPAMAYAQQPFIPASWTVPAWYIDPANATTCATDSNNCTSAACGAAGSGIGPCQTWQEIETHRWGCAGSTACPRLQQNTTITFLSSQANALDPVYFFPSIENSSLVQITGVLNSTTRSSTGTFTAVTSKSRSGKTGLLVTLSGASPGPFDLVVNNTRGSRGILNDESAAGGLEVSQPMTGTQGVALPVEDDTWANGDSYTSYKLAGVFIVAISPTYTAVATPMVVSQLTFLSTMTVAGTISIANINGSIIVADNEFDSKIVSISGGSGQYPAARFVDDAFSSNGQISGAVPPGSGKAKFFMNGDGQNQYSTVPQVFGGSFFDPDSTFEVSFENVWVDYDLIFPKPANAALFTGVDFYGCISIQAQATGGIKAAQAYMAATTAGACTTNAIVWTDACCGGSSTIVFAEGDSRWSYGAATATATFLSGVTLRVNNSGTACSHTGASPDVINCGITLDPSHLDAAAGATGFGGLAFNPGGASFASGL